MVIKVIVNGAEGKMGQETVKAIQHDETFELVGATTKTDDLTAIIVKTNAQVVVDFTVSSVAFTNASIIINAGAHPVIGTSGFLPEQITELKKRCLQKKLGGIIAPNFSIGAVLMMQFAKQAAKYYPQAEIIEMHHQTKEDSPSGTAIRTAELIAANRAEHPKYQKYHETIPGARGALLDDIPIHAVRLPGMIAHQMVIFGGKGEILTIREDTLHRECFMPGVKLACQKVLQIKELVYGLEHFL